MNLAYWAKACSSLARHAVKNPQFGRNLVRSGLILDQQPGAETVPLTVAVPGAEQVVVDMGASTWTISNMDPTERYVIGALVKIRKPRRIFEIGTFDGSTTLLMARNAASSEIFTLDLPPESAERATVAGEAENAATGVGRCFAGTPEASTITQLYGDSRRFDFSPWHGTVDLVLVDGGHTEDCVRPDTEAAHRMLAPGGIIVWDDYMVGWPDVVKAVDEYPRSPGSRLVHVAGTDLAIETTVTTDR